MTLIAATWAMHMAQPMMTAHTHTAIRDTATRCAPSACRPVVLFISKDACIRKAFLHARSSARCCYGYQYSMPDISLISSLPVLCRVSQEPWGDLLTVNLGLQDIPSHSTA